MSRPKRLPTFDYQGPFAYSLTFCTQERQRHFEAEAVVSEVRSAILRTAVDEEFAVLAYCFMPDHVHLLVQGVTIAARLPAFAKLARQRASVASRGMRHGLLWQEGYFERTLRRDEDLASVAEYIAHNPVRAGLVKRAEQWPGSGGMILDAMWDGALRRN